MEGCFSFPDFLVNIKLRIILITFSVCFLSFNSFFLAFLIQTIQVLIDLISHILVYIIHCLDVFLFLLVSYLYHLSKNLWKLFFNDIDEFIAINVIDFRVLSRNNPELSFSFVDNINLPKITPGNHGLKCNKVGIHFSHSCEITILYLIIDSAIKDKVHSSWTLVLCVYDIFIGGREEL